MSLWVGAAQDLGRAKFEHPAATAVRVEWQTNAMNQKGVDHEFNKRTHQKTKIGLRIHS